MLNKVILMGRLTKDPSRRETQSGTSVTSFTLACERDFKTQGEDTKQTDFLDVVAWRNTADFVAKWFRKGQLVAVSGRLQSRKWQDKDGNNRVSIEIVADDCYFAERREPTEPSAMPPPSPLPAQSSFNEIDIDDGDLPF